MPAGYSPDAKKPPQAFPLTQQDGEPYDAFMARVVQRGKQLTPQEMQQAEAAARDPKKIATVLGSAALAGPALLTAGAIAPEAASAAAGGGIAGGVAAGATGGAGAELLRQAVTGENPISKEGAIDFAKATGTGAVGGGLLATGGKLLSYGAGKASELWDVATGYRKALDAAQQAIQEAKASYPSGAEGEWAKTNEILNVPQRSLRVSQNPDVTFGNAGRGLATEGLTYDQLQTMKPPDILRQITPRLQAAGKAVQATADQATANGTILDGGKSAFEAMKSIKDPALQEKAVDLFNQHTRDLEIFNTRDMTPTEALRLRQALRNDANFNSLQPGIGTKLYRAVSSDLHNAVPELALVDMHYGDLTSAVQAAQKQTGRYLLGKWTPPTTRIQEAESALPSRSDFTKPALVKLGQIGATAGLGTGLVRLGAKAWKNNTQP